MNEFNDFSIQDEFDAFMYDQPMEDQQTPPNLANQQFTENHNVETMSKPQFNFMDEEFGNKIPSLSPNISPLRKSFELPKEASKLSGHFFRNVLNTKYNCSPFSKYTNINLPTFGRAEVRPESNERDCEVVNSPRSYLSNNGGSRPTSNIRIPPINISQINPEKRETQNLNSYKKLKIPRLTGFQIYPSIANEVQKSTNNLFLTKNESSSAKYDDAQMESASNSNTCTFEQHESTQDDKDPEMVGPLTRKQREAKVKRFLEKRKRRQYNKKVCYESRKKVADTRPRYKGRFVSFEQAGELVEEYKKELEKKLIKDRVFLTEIFSKKTKNLRKIIFPNEESMSKYAASNVV